MGNLKCCGDDCRLKRTPKWALILVIILCAAAIAACTASPAHDKEGNENFELFGDYVFEKQIYVNPLSSFLALDGYIEYYTLTEDALVLTDEAGNQEKIAVAYKQSELDEQEFKNGFLFDDTTVPDISKYKEKRQYTMTDADDVVRYRIYRLDDEIWLARIHQDNANTEKSEYIWHIYKIISHDGEIPTKSSVQ